MIAIYKKELKSYFYSFIGFLFIAVIICLLGLHTSVYNLYYASPYISSVLAGIVLLFFISIPILTMRILAEEKKQKTDQLILTAPITVKDIVVGKFFALSTIFAIPTAVICLLPIILSRFGEVPMGENYLSILGFFLYGETCIAIGIFISSLTESQVIAAVLSFAILFVGYLMSSICNLISATGNWITRFLRCFDLYTPFFNLTQGTLNLESVAYYLSIILLMLFLTVQSIQKRRYTVSKKAFSIGAYSTGMIAVMVVLTVVFNMAIGLLPNSIRAVDITNNKIYSLTDQTKEFIKQLQEDVTIYVYVNENQKDYRFDLTLQQYEELSDYIHVEYVDPALNPKFTEQYTTNDLSVNSIIVVSDKRSKVVDASKFYVSSYDKETQTSSITGYDGEGLVTSAIAYVTLEETKRLYIMTGHDEVPLSDTFKNALGKQNIAYKSLELMQLEEIPEDASCVLINAPTKDLSQKDVEKLTAYLKKGGNVVIVLALTANDTPNIDVLLDYMALKTLPGVLIETKSTHYNTLQTWLLPNIQPSNYTGTFSSKDYILAPLSRALAVNKENESAQGTLYTAFLKTSEEAFCKTDSVDMEETYEIGENDVAASYAIAVEAVKYNEDAKDETLVVISSQFLFTDETNDIVSGSNLQLFMNIVSRFTEYKVNFSIPSKSYQVSSLVMSQFSKNFIAVSVALVVPVVLLITGFVIWFIRRKR